MKKTTLGLLIWFMTGFSVVALADLPKDGYFQLKVVRIGQQRDTAYLAVHPDNPDRLVLLKSEDLMINPANVDYSLWAFTVKASAVGQNAYEIVNKRGLKFAFDEPAVPIKGDDPADANEALARLQPEGVLGLWNDIVVASDTFLLQSDIGGSKYQLSLLGNDSITIAGTTGSKTSEYLFFIIERPKERWMTAKELNAKFGDGFKLFFYYQDTALTSGLNPAAVNGMKFYADTSLTMTQDTTVFYLRVADTVATKKYLYVDTTSYLDDKTGLMYGRYMKLKADTFPTHWQHSSPLDSLRKFSFRIDPGSFKDSVAAFVHMSRKWNGITAGWDSVSRPDMDKLFPVQVTLHTDGNYYLVTDSVVPDSRTRIAFKEIVYPTKLKRGKIYSIRVLNEGVNKGKYWVSSLRGERDYVASAYDNMAYTQFVYEGYELVNRDARAVRTLQLYKISEIADIYTNINRDTLEIKEMGNADKHSHTLSFEQFRGSIVKENYMIDITTGGFAGKVIGMSSDSIVTILEDDLKYFKISPAHDLRAYGGAYHYVSSDKQDSISEQRRQSYYFRSLEKNEYVSVDTVTNTLVVTTTDSTAFYLRKTTKPKEFVLIYGRYDIQDIADDTLKVQVNSQSGSLELVDMKVRDNHFRIRSESDIATYKKEAKGYYEFASYLGSRLTKNAGNYAVYRNEGDPILKSDVFGEDDFKLYLEPALTAGLNKNKPSYYIVKDAVLGGSDKEVSGYFLHVLDSGKVADPTPYQVEIGGLYYNRLNFVKGKRFSGDSILVNYESASHTKGDSIGYEGKNERGIKEYRFFLRETDVPDEYLLVSELGFDGQGNEDGYLSMLNDVLFVSPRSSAYTVRVTETAPPLSNDGVIDNEIKVVSEKGAITILNAAGKQISVMNILGKMIKNTYVFSDRERIELPQGVVIINIAGEKALKAIVK